MNVIPARAQLRIDCRDAARARRGDGPPAHRRGPRRDADGLEIEFTEQHARQRLTGPDRADGRDHAAGSQTAEPGASTVPLILPGFSDSKWFRDAFPDCVAYGFFPMRHQGLLEATR